MREEIVYMMFLLNVGVIDDEFDSNEFVYVFCKDYCNFVL